MPALHQVYVEQCMVTCKASQSHPSLTLVWRVNILVPVLSSRVLFGDPLLNQQGLNKSHSHLEDVSQPTKLHLAMLYNGGTQKNEDLHEYIRYICICLYWYNPCSTDNVQFLAYSKWLMNAHYARTLGSVSLQNSQTYRPSQVNNSS